MLVLEDLGGEPLDRILDGPLELARLLRIAVGLTAALGKLHEQGLLHKDIKLAKVIVHRTFNATFWAASSWLFFRVARSTRINSDMGASLGLEKQPTDLRRNSRDLGDGTLAGLGKESRLHQLRQFPLKLFRMVRIEGITARVFDRAISPMSVEPEPLLRVLSDCWFKPLPTCLRNLLVGGLLTEFERFEQPHHVSPIWLQQCDKGLDASVCALMENGVHRCDSHSETKCANYYRRL
jgi:hypothetical protein